MTVYADLGPIDYFRGSRGRYRPPDAFIDAVLRCPDADTSDYQAAMCSIDPDVGGR